MTTAPGEWQQYLVRYGAVPEVARFVSRDSHALVRGDRVVVQTHRGLQTGDVLEQIKSPSSSADGDPDFQIVRAMTPDDEQTCLRLKRRCDDEFFEWCRHILLWNLPLELIDLERTLDDEKLILYVLTERGPATTTLALQAAAAGLGVVEVQPVTSAGLVALPAAGGGGCGTGGCGCHTETHETETSVPR